MMDDMGSDEFAEFETTEDQIDAMMAAGEPVEVDVPGQGLRGLYVRVGASNLSWGGSSVVPVVSGTALVVHVAGPVKAFSSAAA